MVMMRIELKWMAGSWHYAMLFQDFSRDFLVNFMYEFWKHEIDV